MGKLLDAIQWCETVEGWWCNFNAPIAKAVLEHVRARYGGPAFSSFGCPPGDKPAAPQLVYAELASAEWWSEIDADGAKDIQAYVVEQYELAYNAWRSRVSFCTGAPPAEPPTPTPGTPTPPAEPKPPKGGPPPLGQPSESPAGFGGAGVALVAVAALLLWSRSGR